MQLGIVNAQISRRIAQFIVQQHGDRSVATTKIDHLLLGLTVLEQLFTPKVCDRSAMIIGKATRAGMQ
jgi:hypothetical protein